MDFLMSAPQQFFSKGAPLPAPLGYWKFNDGSGLVAADSSGNGFNLTINAAPVWTTGQFGGACHFNGQVGRNLSIPLAASGYTTATWANFATLPGFGELIYSGNTVINGAGLAVGNGSGAAGSNLGVEVSGVSFNVLSPNFTLTANVWTHICCTVASPGNFIVYVNGVAVATGAATVNPPSSEFAVAGSLNSSRFADVVLDETRYYNSVLTPAQVTALFNLIPGP